MDNSTKPYLIRAIYDWCLDNGYTPYISVRVIGDEFGNLMGYARNGEITLNVSAHATPNISFGNDVISCSARFNGASQDLCVPVTAVSAIFARENGQGMSFPPNEETLDTLANDTTTQQKAKSKTVPTKRSSKPTLHVIK